jgi:hypothetical protein
VRLPAGREVVLKPSVGVGSVGSRRFTDAGAALAYAADLHRQGRSVLVQPYDARVERGGETALVFLGGKASHAFTRAAILPPAGRPPQLDVTGSYAVQTLTPAEPDFELWDIGFAALDAAAGRLGITPRDLLYARVDLLGGIDDPRLLDLELVQPPLGWRRLDPDTRERQLREFALSVESALQRLGLGPLSHRRP